MLPRLPSRSVLPSSVELPRELSRWQELLERELDHARLSRLKSQRRPRSQRSPRLRSQRRLRSLPRRPLRSQRRLPRSLLQEACCQEGCKEASQESCQEASCKEGCKEGCTKEEVNLNKLNLVPDQFKVA